MPEEAQGTITAIGPTLSHLSPIRTPFSRWFNPGSFAELACQAGQDVGAILVLTDWRGPGGGLELFAPEELRHSRAP